MKISATIITLNEEKNIKRAIESLNFADEIILVDAESSDKTREIAKSLGAKVYTRKWPGFANQKQFAVHNADHDYIFSLDADEEVSKELQEKILKLKALPEEKLADGYRIPRLSFYMGRPIRHSGWYPDRQLRLFNRSSGFWKDVAVHESIQMENESVVEKLEGDILHYTVENALQHHKMIGERYAPLAATQMFKDGISTSYAKIFIAGFAAFLRSYILKAGFLDGLPGFAIARFAAHNAFLKHLLLYEMHQNKAIDV